MTRSSERRKPLPAERVQSRAPCRNLWRPAATPTGPRQQEHFSDAFAGHPLGPLSRR